MKFFKHTVALALGFFLFAGAAFAQGQQMQQQQAQPDSITDAELEKFAAVTSEVQKIQQESQQKVQAIVEDTDLNMQRFQKIMMSRQNPQMADSVDVTDEEQKIIEEIKPKLMKMQQSSRKEMMGAMQENGLNPQRFQAIMKAVQSNPEVMQRFQEIAKDTTQQ